MKETGPAVFAVGPLFCLNNRRAAVKNNRRVRVLPCGARTYERQCPHGEWRIAMPSNKNENGDNKSSKSENRTENRAENRTGSQNRAQNKSDD